MEESDEEGIQKRQFFRIDDLSQLEYKIIESANNKLADHTLSPHLTHRAKWMDAFERIDEESASSLHQIMREYPTMGTYLNHLNRKIQLLLESLVEIDSSEENASAQHINLSEGGLAFDVDEYLEPDTYLAISLLLRPTYKPFLVIARVVKCHRQKEQNHYRAAVTFTEIRETDRQIIAKHILRLQMLRRREQNNADKKIE